jgi:hypothetical protein
MRDDVGRLYVLVDKSTPVQAVQRGCDADRNAQELCELQRPLYNPIKWLSAWIREHQGRLASISNKSDRLRRPRRVKFASKLVFTV